MCRVLIADDDPVRHVGGAERVLIRPDDRIAEVAEEVVVGIEIACAVRAHVRHAQVAAFVGEIPPGGFEFPVPRFAR